MSTRKTTLSSILSSQGGDPVGRPNIVVIVSDDHAAHAISAFGSTINTTPGIDRIAREGVRMDASFCTNALCAPSRAAILTGTYNHVNGMRSNGESFDARQPSFPALLQAAGYQSFLSGKWHLGHGGIHDPVGLDRWSILDKHGTYLDSEFLGPDGERVVRPGYVTDVITDTALDWLRDRDRDRPFCAVIAHKAPHEPWVPADRHAQWLADDDVPEPETFIPDFSGRGTPSKVATMSILDDMPLEDFKVEVPADLDREQQRRWKYQRFIKDYLRVVRALDENVGRVLDFLDDDGIAADTVVIYTSDQGFYLGDHGWYDKRFMYDQSLKVPTVVRYPREISAGTTTDAIVLNVDLAPTLLDYAGVEVPARMQGRSMREVLAGATPTDWRDTMYYRYWVHRDRPHNVWSHYGVRSDRHKLICFYAQSCDTVDSKPEPRPVEWELYDLAKDPWELHNRFDDPGYVSIRQDLVAELLRLQEQLGDGDCAPAEVLVAALPATR